jgi:hypothetical protein
MSSSLWGYLCEKVKYQFSADEVKGLPANYQIKIDVIDETRSAFKATDTDHPYLTQLARLGQFFLDRQ